LHSYLLLIKLFALAINQITDSKHKINMLTKNDLRMRKIKQLSSQTIAFIIFTKIALVVFPADLYSENSLSNTYTVTPAGEILTDADKLISENLEISTGSNGNNEITEQQPGHGQINGQVIDAATDEPLVGVTVILANTAIGAVTDADGHYNISRLPAGKQTLVIRYLGYLTENIEVNVIPDQKIVLDVSLVPDIILGQEVVVYAQATGQAKAIREQLRSNTIVNVVSEARLREIPDANAAESIGRLPGVSILRDAGEGQKVAIRGMGPRYSSITIDGNKVPGTDGDRSVDLSMISPEMLSGIEVYKSIRPDMDADAIGGSVNFRMGGAPSETLYRLSVEGGYNNQLEGIGNYAASLSGSQRFFKNRLGIMLSANAEQVDRSAQILGSGYRILRDAREDEPHAPIEVTGLNLTDRKSTRQRLGGGISLDWNLPNGSIFLNNVFNQQEREDLTQSRRYNLNDNRQEWRPGRTQRNIFTLNSTLSGQHKMPWFEVEWRLNRSVTKNNTPYNHQAWFFEPSAMNIIDVDLTGGPQIIPSIALNRTETSFLETLINNESAQSQQNLSASTDIKVPLNLGRYLTGYVKFGAKHYNNYRDQLTTGYRVFNWEFTPLFNDTEGTFPWLINSTGRASMEAFVTDPDYRYNIINNEYGMAHLPNIGLVDQMWDDYSNHYRRLYYTRLNDYKATERLSAGYIMTELNIGPRLMIMPGVRYEHEHSEYTATVGEFPGSQSEITEEELGNFFTDSLATRNMGMWFPMVQARYKVTSWFDIRAARTVSTSRPSFSDLAPRFNISYDGKTVNRAHTQIRPMRSTNYDLFLTFYHNRLGLFTLGGFTKSVEDLIYTRNANIVFPEELGLPATTRLFAITEPVNNENITTVDGFEVEWQSNLTWLPSPFNGIVVNANYSRFFSEAHYHSFEFKRTAQGIVGIDTFRIARMTHQADHIANISLGYDFKGFSSRIAMQYQGATLRSIGNRPETDLYTDDYLRFDASIRQRFFNGRMSVFANLNNITNRQDRSSQFTYDRPRSIEYYGFTIDIGMEFRF
jgi:TonB-dependent receptor